MELNQIIVTDKGIEQVDEIFYNGEMYCSKVIIPKEIFIEAYNKFIDNRLEFTSAELRQISNLMTENARLKTKLDKHNKAFDNIKDALNKWNPDTKISILSVYSILDRNLDEFADDITEDEQC